MTLSILHRMTGVALSLGFVVLVLWLESLAFGEPDYAWLTAIMGTWAGRLVLMGMSFAFFFHLGNGVRHLFWDAGLGFEKHQAEWSAWAVVAAAVLMTAGFWLLLPGAQP
jgi:succinate dehydrogenase / fumarate reductase cytochrome b subunit